MEILLFALVVSLSFLTLGFAQSRGEQIVTVALKHSTTIWGARYHPNSKGVKMPRSHAQALGAEIINDDHRNEAKTDVEDVEPPEETETVLTPSEDFASTDTEIPEPDKDVTETDTVDSGQDSDAENANVDEKSPSVSSELPQDFPARDFLIKNGIDSIEKILAVPDLTDYKGIGGKTAKAIITQAKQIESTW